MRTHDVWKASVLVCSAQFISIQFFRVCARQTVCGTSSYFLTLKMGDMQGSADRGMQTQLLQALLAGQGAGQPAPTLTPGHATPPTDINALLASALCQRSFLNANSSVPLLLFPYAGQGHGANMPVSSPADHGLDPVSFNMLLQQLQHQQQLQAPVAYVQPDAAMYGGFSSQTASPVGSLNERELLARLFAAQQANVGGGHRHEQPFSASQAFEATSLAPPFHVSEVGGVSSSADTQTMFGVGSLPLPRIGLNASGFSTPSITAGCMSLGGTPGATTPVGTPSKATGERQPFRWERGPSTGHSSPSMSWTDPENVFAVASVPDVGDVSSAQGEIMLPSGLLDDLPEGVAQDACVPKRSLGDLFQDPEVRVPRFRGPRALV